MSKAIVPLKGTQAFANSRDVAEFFGKQHKHVLRDIDVLKTGGPDMGHLFHEHADYHDKARKLVRAFDMTKDGFTLLAMGFTGAKACSSSWPTSLPLTNSKLRLS